MNNTAVAVITNNKGEFLLQKKDQGYMWFPGKWCLFGGHIENEKPEEALIRELREEIGCSLANMQLYKTFKYEVSCIEKTERGTQYVYTGTFCGNISDISLKEGAGFAFFSVQELEHLDISKPDKKILKDILKNVVLNPSK